MRRTVRRIFCALLAALLLGGICTPAFASGGTTGKVRLTVGDYEGELLNGKPNGTGTLTYFSNDEQMRQSYVGQWKDGATTGLGTLTWTNGQRYSGQWSNGWTNGWGVMFFENGSIIIGEWLTGNRNGIFWGRDKDGKTEKAEYTVGVYSSVTQGSTQKELTEGSYTGYWSVSDNRPAIRGTLTYKKDDSLGRVSYTGGWENGERSGTGAIAWSNGAFFAGSWKDNYRNGLGILVDSDGAVTRGLWSNDKLNGDAVVIEPSGTIKTVTYKDGAAVTAPNKVSAQNSGNLLPDIQSFSDNKMEEVSRTIYDNYTMVRYNLNYNGKFLKEYLDLLQNTYGFKLRDSNINTDSTGSFGWYTFDYNGSGVEKIDPGFIVTDSYNIALGMHYSSSLFASYIMIYYADGLNCTDTGERTSHTLTKYESETAAPENSSSSSSSSSVTSPWNTSTTQQGVRCYKCHGNRTITCTNCDGKGGKEKVGYTPNYTGTIGGAKKYTTWETCFKCHGLKTITCPICNGRGTT